jgi:hypothetical protein
MRGIREADFPHPLPLVSGRFLRRRHIDLLRVCSAA